MENGAPHSDGSMPRQAVVGIDNHWQPVDSDDDGVLGDGGSATSAVAYGHKIILIGNVT
ncbi:hypothetical protein Pfo_022628 [Paulownia fortunei]|nr:hypothetical protein Pfo_022628 [Paulownia fortunei]